MEIAELANSSVAELREHAETLNIPYYATLRKPELVFRIHQGLAPADAVPTIEGVLDIRPEGYGFLRSGQWQYQYGPDDVYVSPAHIRRFSLRKGDTLAGRVRPPAAPSATWPSRRSSASTATARRDWASAPPSTRSVPATRKAASRWSRPAAASPCASWTSSRLSEWDSGA